MIRSLNIFNPWGFFEFFWMYGITGPHVRPSQLSRKNLRWNRPVLMRVGHFRCMLFSLFGHFYFLSAIFVLKSTTLAVKMAIFDPKSAIILVKLAWEFSKIFILGFFFHFYRKSIVTNWYEIGYFCLEIDRFWFESVIFIAKSAISIFKLSIFVLKSTSLAVKLANFDVKLVIFTWKLTPKFSKCIVLGKNLFFFEKLL